jgi:large subunit ribosomal protein L19e|tara:strand:+ start:707 stop:1114 length:408 start_codon:yes stop_codon:yes gene_type:complete
MNLGKKKELASRTLLVGKERIVFLKSRLNEIKEAITKQDIKDLKSEGAIIVKEIKGRKKNQSSSKKRGPGKIKKNVSRRKQDYVIMTRKLRACVSEMKKTGKISNEDFQDIRKKIRNKTFRSKAHLKEYVKEIKK